MNKYSHFFLYAKGHYKTSNSRFYYKNSKDQISDLKIITANYTGIPKKYITINNILNILADISYNEIIRSRESFDNYLNDLSNKTINMLNFNNDPYMAIAIAKIESYLSILRFMTIDNIKTQFGDLLKPDFSILPLKKSK